MLSRTVRHRERAKWSTIGELDVYPPSHEKLTPELMVDGNKATETPPEVRFRPGSTTRLSVLQSLANDGEYGTMAKCEESVKKEYEQRIDDISVEEPMLNPDKGQECIDVLNESTCEEYWDEFIDPSGDTYLLCYDEVWSL